MKINLNVELPNKMNAHGVLLELYHKSLEWNWVLPIDTHYQWLLLGSGLSAAFIATLSWCCGGEDKTKRDLEMRSLHYDIDRLISEVNKLKRNVDGLKTNYQQIVDFLRSDE